MMTQDSLGGGAPRFEVGRVISTSISVFTRNLVPFFVLSVIIGIPYILVTFLFATSMDIAQIQATGQLPSGFWGMWAISMLIFILTYSLIQSAIVYGTVQDLRGQKASFGDCLARGFSSLPRVIVAAVLANIAIMIGIMLLVVPGVVLILMWWVLIPALVIEGAGIGQSFGRSRTLTSGHRWGILGILVIVAVIQWVISWVIGMLGMALGIMVAQIINLAIMLLFMGFASVLSAVGYYFLRAEKEGIVIDDLAKVFD
jgi:hypothetical protein